MVKSHLFNQRFHLKNIEYSVHLYFHTVYFFPSILIFLHEFSMFTDRLSAHGTSVVFFYPLDHAFEVEDVLGTTI